MQETPIVLLVEIHKPKNFKLIFSRSFLQIIVEIGEKYAQNPLFNILEAQLASKNRKLKSAVVDPPPIYMMIDLEIQKLKTRPGQVLYLIVSAWLKKPRLRQYRHH